ncbi:MAG TPA: hypothetical protein VGB49_01210, partial [Caulobacteraceae bacterium]
LVSAAPPPDGELVALADRLRGAEGMSRLELFLDRLAEAVRDRATAAGGRGVEAWASLWDRLSGAASEAEGLNLDRGDVFWTAVNELKRVRAC